MNLAKAIILWLALAFACFFPASTLASTAPESRIWEISNIGYDPAVAEVTALGNRTETSTSDYDSAPIPSATTEEIPTEAIRSLFGQITEFKAAEGESGLIYRGATQGNANHVAVREGESAVSFRDSLSNPLGQPLVLRPGRNYIEVDTSLLPPGTVTRDGGTIVDGQLMPPGHVSVTATPEQILNATTGGGKFPK